MGGVYITARKPSVGQVETLLNVYRCHSLQQLANGHTYVLTKKPYITVIDFHSIETETCRHCIFAHQMKLQLNLMYICIVNHVRGKVHRMPVLYGSQQLLQNNNVYWTKKESIYICI